MTISEIRRENLRKLKAERGGAQSLAKALNRPTSFLSQLAGPNPSREVSENNAREFEESLGLPKGFFDVPPDAPKVVPPTDVNLLGDVMRHVAEMCDAEQVPRDKLDFSKMGDLASLVLTDAVEHGGKLREDHTRKLVRLLK